MKKYAKHIKNMILILCMLSYVAIYLTVIVENHLKYSESITATFLLVLSLAAIGMFGYTKDKFNGLKKNMLTVVIISLLAYFIIIYGAGKYVGFLKNSYSLKLYAIFNNLLAPTVIIIASELIRYVVLTSNKDKKIIKYLITITLIIFDVMLSIKIYDLTKISDSFRFLSLSLLPAIMKHSTLTYLTDNTGIKVSLTFRLIYDSYIYLVPLVPDLGEYLTSVSQIFFPFMVYIYTSRIFMELTEGIEIEIVRKAYRITDIPLITCALILFALVSRLFPIYMIGIGSGSMTPKIKIGDAIIVQKVKSDDEIKINDVIAYKKGDKTIVHRVIEINEGENTYYVTKGDANNVDDGLLITIDDIEGKVMYKIPYIAYPTVKLQELIDKENR